MSVRVVWIGVSLVVLSWLMVGCGGKTRPSPELAGGGDSESHFLSLCEAGDCPVGWVCSCGACTRGCDADAQCDDLSAVCREPTLGSCQAERSCQVECREDADCRRASAEGERECAAGWCRPVARESTASEEGPLVFPTVTEDGPSLDAPPAMDDAPVLEGMLSGCGPSGSWRGGLSSEASCPAGLVCYCGQCAMPCESNAACGAGLVCGQAGGSGPWRDCAEEALSLCGAGGCRTDVDCAGLGQYGTCVRTPNEFGQLPEEGLCQAVMQGVCEDAGASSSSLFQCHTEWLDAWVQGVRNRLASASLCLPATAGEDNEVPFELCGTQTCGSSEVGCEAASEGFVLSEPDVTRSQELSGQLTVDLQLGEAACRIRYDARLHVALQDAIEYVRSSRDASQVYSAEDLSLGDAWETAARSGLAMPRLLPFFRFGGFEALVVAVEGGAACESLPTFVEETIHNDLRAGMEAVLRQAAPETPARCQPCGRADCELVCPRLPLE